MNARSRWIIGFAVFAWLGSPLGAQPPQGASLQVTVEDDLGGVIVGAQATLTPAPGGQVREGTTNGQGVAEFRDLAQGEYTLVISAPGFRNDERRLAIGPQPPRPLRVRLGIEVTEVVEVEERRRPLPKLQEIDQNADAVNVNDDTLVGVPMALRGDRIIGFLSRFMNPAAGPPSIVMDGQEVTRLNLPPRAIDEIVVNKNPYSAEYRRPGRARVEVISQDGSEDHHHADATFAFNNSSLSARNPFARQKQDVSESIVEMGFSGPLRSGNGSYLFAAELGGDRVGAVVNALTPSGPVTGFVSEKQRETFWTGRIDLAPSDRVGLTFRYEYDHESERNGGVGGLVLPELAVNGDGVKQDFYFGFDHILSANSIHEPRVRISYETERAGTDPRGPKVVVNGAFEGGVSQEAIDLRLFQADFQETFTYRRGTHVFRFGGRFSPSFYRVSNRSNFGGTFEFANLEAFAAGRPFAFSVNDGNPAIQYGHHVADAYVQDEIKLRPDFTLMLGARYDWESILRDKNNIAPRVAVAFAPGDRRTALRGGTGIFYERLGRNAYERVELYGGSRIRTLVYNNPSYPDARAAGTATIPTPTVFQFAPGMTTPFVTQTSVGLDRQLSVETAFSVEYLHLRGSNSFRVRDLNTPLPGTGLRPNPAFQNVIQIEPTGRMRSNAVHLTFNGEVGQFEGHVAYTYSRSYNDVPGSSVGGALSLRLPSNNLDPRLEWGRADFDRRHRFSMAGVYEFPREIELGFILDAFSGFPYEITTGFDDNGDSVANDRPAGVARNAGRGPKFVQLDMRVQKMWQVKRPLDPGEDPAEIKVFLDVFNVLNTINYTDIIGVMSSPRFGQPTFAEKGRLLQMGITYTF
jgi:hypothetical protein